MRIFIIFICLIVQKIDSQDDGPEILSVNVDGLLMENAKITSSATCGTSGPEKYCRLVDEIAIQRLINPESHVLCDICDDRNETKRHPIEFAKSDDDNLWWQSPSMAQGLKYQNVNVTIDLKQVYQIVYILLKMGDSPRPGNWILERSLDGEIYMPWIFFAETPYSCYNLFQRQYPDLQLTTSAKPSSLADDEMFCTTYYSQPKSLNSGEIIISLINGRKSIMNEEYLSIKSVPQKLINFLSARYIRFRFLKHLTLTADLMTHKGYLEQSIYNRYYYSLRNIEIGGKCICNNHADKCDKVIENGISVAKCNCKHNTCGSNCEICCPLFNQKPWKPVAICEECNCNRKSNKCSYNQTVATLQLSVNKMGRMEGGGVCIKCQENTEGINCEKCIKGFYRPWDVLATEPYPCKPCQCHGLGTIGNCVSNGEDIGDQKPGDCICKKGYEGVNCDSCSIGYERYPNGECLPCPCFIDGSVRTFYRCKPPCNCKVHVNSNDLCKTCKNGYFNLDSSNPEGCEPCYCFGITNQCSSLSARNLKISDLKDWKLTTIMGDKIAIPKFTSLEYLTSENSYIDERFNNPTVYYWDAPQPYLGNWITSYGTIFRYIVKIELQSTVKGSLIDSPDVIIKCGDFRLFYSVNIEDRRIQRQVFIYIKPAEWKIGKLLPEKVATKDEFISCLVKVDKLLIKAKYYSNQKSIELLNITLSRGEVHLALNEMPHIEKCNCPPGYNGLSCESCESGYRRVNNVLYQGQCEACACYNHSNTCNSFNGECQNCTHNTAGTHCEDCADGYYGDARSKNPNSCKTCPCPLLDYQMTKSCSSFSSENYVCHKCMHNTSGIHCDRCIEGYYGNPKKKIPCKRCQCNNNQESCNSVTGECRCSYNTMGAKCQLCKYGFYGNALNKSCQKCNCDSLGSTSENCDKLTGKCDCRTNFANRQCDSCVPGLYLKDEKCIPCNCEIQGRINSEKFCNATSGQCFCLENVNGDRCEKCLQGYFNYPNCKKCLCSPHALSVDCDSNDGKCKCGPNVINRICDKCENLHYWYNQTDCVPCNCGKGSSYPKCDMETGNCKCARNVATRDCSMCEIGYFGLSVTGCKKCPPCYNGQICNNDGKCVCPLNTVGNRCNKCSDDSWDFNATIGCKKCNCYIKGSYSHICNKVSGLCACKTAFFGSKCDQCNAGYYGFPNCQPCSCSKNGTISNKLTKCDKITGQCQCKQNVIGTKCEVCKKGTFPSDSNYEGGCFSCFCFGISEKCHAILNHRISENSIYEYHIFDEKDSFESGKDYSIINLNATYPRKFGWPLTMFRPIYVNVMKLFNSHDLSLFYRSIFMTVSVDCLGNKCGRENPVQTEVFMESYNGLFGLRYIVNHSVSNSNDIIVDFNEHSKNGKWVISRYKNDILDKFIILENSNVININLTRDIFMMALLNVTSFKVKLYTETVNPPLIKLKIVTYKILETTQAIGKPITAVEKCVCNALTFGNHCQNPISGYYKEYFNLPNSTKFGNMRTGNRILINLKKCNCNEYSKVCDSVTGDCRNCMGNREGNKCQLCMKGFYKDDKSNDQCKPCQCPTSHYNYAQNCTRIKSSLELKCECQIGYSGKSCEFCEQGFYGNPIKGIPCQSCNCNQQGSQSLNCNEFGICQCSPGVLGIKCDQCAPNYVVKNKTCQSCYSGCTKDLLVRVDKLNETVINFKWKTLPSTLDLRFNKINISIQMNVELLNSIQKFYKLKDEIKTFSIQFLKMKNDAKEKYGEIEKLKSRYNKVLVDFRSTFTDINETISGNEQLGISKEFMNNVTIYLETIKNHYKEMPNITLAASVLKDVLKYVDELNKIIKYTQGHIQSDQISNLKILKNKTIMADEINTNNKEYLNTWSTKKKEYELYTILIDERMKDLQKILRLMTKQKDNLRKKIQKLDTISKSFQDKKNLISINIQEIEDLMKNLSSNNFISKSLIIPDTLKKHVEEQLNKSSNLIKKLSKDFNFLHNAEQAKEAYSNITRDILAVDYAINQTKKELDFSKSNLNIDSMKKLLVEFNSNKSKIIENIENIDKEHKKLLNQYQNCSDNEKKLKNINEKLSSEIPTGFYDVEILKRNLSEIQIEQANIENNWILPINQTIINLGIPTAKSALDTGNLEKLIKDVDYQYRDLVNESLFVENKIKDLRKSIKSLRERLQKAKVMSALIHGAAARSVEPIRHIVRCVRHYVTYYLPTSNAFSLEFYMKPQFPNDQSLVLFGYDDSGSIPHAFAFTVERNNLYKFWYDSGNSVESIELMGKFSIDNYVGIMIAWKLGKWHMVIRSINEGRSDQVETSSITNNILSNVRIGPQTNIFVGGFPSSKLLKSLKLEGKLISDLKENYDNNFYKGCLFGVRLMNTEFGLQDIEAIEEECRNTISIDNLLLEKFNCKFNPNSSVVFLDSNVENVNTFKRSMRRQKRNIQTNFDLYFTGNGFAMINTSRTKNGKCATTLNKVLTISTMALPKINPETFQLIAVFANKIMNYGFVLGQKMNSYHFGYWKKDFEHPLFPIQNASDSFTWFVFKNQIEKIGESLFGIDEICDQNSLFYLSSIPDNDLYLIEKLKKLKIPNYGFTGKMKFLINKKPLFQVLATRFINVIFLFTEQVRENKFHSLFISPNVINPIEINENSPNDILQNGFGFTVNFMGQPISKTLKLFSIELETGTINVEVSKGLIFSVIINGVKIEKEMQKFNNDNLDWEAHYIVVFLEHKQSSLIVTFTVDNEDIKSQEIMINLGSVNRITLNPSPTNNHSYYIYNLFIGQKLVDFNELNYLPPGVFLKVRPTNLQPVDLQNLRVDTDKSTPRVSYKHGQNLQRDAVALPYIKSIPLYTNSNINAPFLKHKVKTLNLYSFKSQSYPVHSAWFDGISTNVPKFDASILNQYRITENNEISLKILSGSKRPEILMSLNYGTDKILNILTFNGQLILNNPSTRWTAALPILLINEQWHILRITPNPFNSSTGVRVYQDNHSFNFESIGFTLTFPSNVELGDFSQSNAIFSYKDKDYMLKPFTGCLDELQINNNTVSMLNSGTSNSLKQCPRVLELLNSGGQILASYAEVTSKPIQLIFDTNQKSETDYFIKFKFKYTGYESGVILTTGDGEKFCSIAIKNQEIQLIYLNIINKEKSVEKVNIDKEKWYQIIFFVYHQTDVLTICRMSVNNDKIVLLHTLSDSQMFDPNYKMSNLYFGYDPKFLADTKLVSEWDRNFVGCISNVECLVGNAPVNCQFDNSQYFIRGRCSIDKNTYLLRKF